MECAGRAKRRRRFRFLVTPPIQSGVALRLPLHSKRVKPHHDGRWSSSACNFHYSPISSLRSNMRFADHSVEDRGETLKPHSCREDRKGDLPDSRREGYVGSRLGGALPVRCYSATDVTACSGSQTNRNCPERNGRFLARLTGQELPETVCAARRPQ